MWILVAEDEPAMAESLRQGLEEEKHTVALAADGAEAINAAELSGFDAIILDVMMPSLNGIEVARRLRRSGNQAAILMLTARDSAVDIIAGLDAGADDYLVKPFAFSVLLARLRALSRRAAQPSISTLQVDDLILDPARREVSRRGKGLNLTTTEYRFLEHLMRRVGRVASRSSIIEAVWGFDGEIENNTVDAFIKFLRDKIDSGHDRKLIHTVRGYGYVLREPS